MNNDNPQLETNQESILKQAKVQKKRSNKKIILIILGIAVLLLALFAAYMQLSGGKRENDMKTTATSKGGNSADTNGLVSAMPLECVPRGHDYYRTENTLLVDPENPATVYVGVEYKGVFKSTDGGKSWKQSDKGIRGYAKESAPKEKCIQEMGRMIVDPKDNKHLLLTRVESPGDLSTLFSENAGVWESFNAGASWSQMIKPGMNASGSRAIAFDPNDSSVVYHGTNQMHPSYTDGNGQAVNKKYFNKAGILYKTSNGGKNWAELPTGASPGFRTINVAVDPKDSKKLWLFTFTASENGQPVPEEKQKAVLLTSDGGKSWTSYSDKLPSGYRALTDGILSPVDGNNAFVSTMTTTSAPKSFVTTDGAKTWTQSNEYILVANYDTNDSSGHTLLGYAPYSSKPGIYQSVDGGKNWSFYSALPKEVDGQGNFGVRVASFAWTKADKNVVYMSGSGGYVWKSTDAGKTWTTVMTLNKIGGPNKNKDGSTKSREQDPN